MRDSLQEQRMSIKRIQAGPRMSQAVVHGNVVYLAGQVCPPAAGATTVGAQTQVILDQIDRLLAQAGSGKQNLLSATIWLQDMGRFGEMNEVWDKWVTPGSAPARATVEARLAGPQYLVEIAAIAATG
jgi:enamine deaminase RidA (YjgF/YER057c/UK114 family)